MDERVVKFRVGAVVVGTFFILALLVMMFNNVGMMLRGLYTIHVHFPEAPGVAVDTPVRKDGILIGKVTRVRFADEDPNSLAKSAGVIVTLGVFNDIHLRTSERCRITANLLGDAVLQFAPGPGNPSSEFVQNGDYQEGTVAENPLQSLSNLEGGLGEAISSVAVAGNDVGRLARHLDSFLVNNEDPLQRIVVKTEKALDGFQRTVESINVLIGDVSAGGVSRSDDGAALPLDPDAAPEAIDPDDPNVLRRRIVTLPELLAETRDAVQAMRVAVESANRTFVNVEHFTQPLGDRGQDLMNKVDQSVGRLDELLQEFVTFGQALNRKEGSLGQLVNNPDLYQHLNAAACNIEQLTRELKPIIRDARVISDKFARHPEQLGVGGLLKKSSGLK